MIKVNARGARTLADAQPLTYGGQNVYVTTSAGMAQLHLGGRIVAERPAAEITCIVDAQDWAYETIETADEITAQTVPGVSAEDYAEAVHGPAAAQVRENAATALAEAERMDARAQVMASKRTNCTDLRSPRHPLNRAEVIRKCAEGLRRDAETLAAWTAQDEAGYMAYVSEGLGATDGYFAPEDRAAWKRLNG